MSEKSPLEFKISMVGPSRVGKTSLVASILKSGESVLAGTPARLRYADVGTEQRIGQTLNALRGDLAAGEFEPGAVRGTEEPFEYQLLLQAASGSIDNSILFKVLDFPGGWLGAGRPQERLGEWEECLRFMRESTALIIPIESAVLMESRENKAAAKAVPQLLEIEGIEQIVRDWVKCRITQSNNAPNLPALIIFCPVKCESYFDDNGGLKKLADKLRECFEIYYGVVLDVIKDEIKGNEANLSGLKVWYMPVDTVGCVEICSGKWSSSNIDGELNFAAKYRVRDGGKMRAKGADVIFVELCRQFMRLNYDLLQADASSKYTESKSAEEHAGQKEGFWKDIWLSVSGRRKGRLRKAEQAKQAAEVAAAAVKPIGDLLEKINSLADDREKVYRCRVKELR